MGGLVLGSDSEGEDQKIHVERRKNRLQQQQQQEQPKKQDQQGGKNPKPKRDQKPKLDVPQDRSLSVITKEQKEQLMDTDEGNKGSNNPPKPPKSSDQIDFPEASRTQMQSFRADGQQAVYNNISVSHHRIDDPAQPVQFPSRTSMATMAIESRRLKDTRVATVLPQFFSSVAENVGPVQAPCLYGYRSSF